jgi:hypothetical protein
LAAPPHAGRDIDDRAPITLVSTALGYADLKTTSVYAHARPGERARSKEHMMVAYDREAFRLTAPSQRLGKPMRKTLLLVASVALSSPVLADDREDCSSIDVDRIIQGCTGVIKSRQELRQTLAIAYHRRGTAHASKKEYDQAIEDYTKALEIDPKYISAYNDRGLAYTSKGDYERAIADVTRAVELTAKPTSRPTTAAATPPAATPAKSEPSSTKTSVAIGNATAPTPVKPTTTPPMPPSTKASKTPGLSKTSATKAKPTVPTKKPETTPTPTEIDSGPPSWAVQVLNKEMN